MVFVEFGDWIFLWFSAFLDHSNIKLILIFLPIAWLFWYFSVCEVVKRSRLNGARSRLLLMKWWFLMIS